MRLIPFSGIYHTPYGNVLTEFPGELFWAYGKEGTDSQTEQDTGTD